MKTILLAGSNHSKSINQQLINYVGLSIENAEVIDLRGYDVPMYSIDFEEIHGIPESIKKLNKKLDEASTLVMALPEHNAISLPFLKIL